MKLLNIAMPMTQFTTPFIAMPGTNLIRAQEQIYLSMSMGIISPTQLAVLNFGPTLKSVNIFVCQFHPEELNLNF